MNVADAAASYLAEAELRYELDELIDFLQAAVELSGPLSLEALYEYAHLLHHAGARMIRLAEEAKRWRSA